jgi:hypothetical protein
MEKKYVINESTLTRIADAIRVKESSSESIALTDFAHKIDAIEPTLEDYMRITDYLDYPTPLDESNYTNEELARCMELYTFYLEMEDVTNG